MRRPASFTGPLACFMALLITALAAGCGGGGERDPLLGTGGIGALAPTVISTAPGNAAVGLPLNVIINATFSEPMAPITGDASFTVNCAAPCVNATGTAVLDGSNRVASFTLSPAGSLAPLTLYTVTVSGARSLATGLALASPYVWRFTTGATADTSRPRVTLTGPATTIPGPTAGAPGNAGIVAYFTEDMLPATINAASFTLSCAAPCVSPAGAVSYDAGSRTAIFMPAAALAGDTTYTATITTAAADLAGNALAGNQAPLTAASNYVWSFTTTAAPIQRASISVLSTSPASGAVGVSPSATISVTFSVLPGLRIDPATVTPGLITVTGPAPAVTHITAASLVLDGATGLIVTLTPVSALRPGLYSVLLKGGANDVKTLAIPADIMGHDYAWLFTVTDQLQR